MISILIDGIELQVPPGTTILEAARDAGFQIPTLCYHKSLKPFGSCRLCVVELSGAGGEKKQVVSSCAYPVEEKGLIVHTETPAVLQARKMILSLLLARYPGVELLQKLAAEWWVDSADLPVEGDPVEDCILCGRCVRVCREVIGKDAISFAYRGVERRVSSPFDQNPPDCIGCTACAHVCPTGAVRISEENKRRFIAPWHSELELLTCLDCGEAFVPRAVLDHLEKILPGKEVPKEVLRPGFDPVDRADPASLQAASHRAAVDTALCSRCRRKRAAGVSVKNQVRKVDYLQAGYR